MHIISKKKLKAFWEEYPDSKNALTAWFNTMRGGKFTTFHELKEKAFGTADQVGKRVAFDIGGNKYRLIAVIHFNRHKVFIRNVLTHKEYDKGEWKSG